MSFASLVEPVPHESRSEEESSEERWDASRLSRLMRSARGPGSSEPWLSGCQVLSGDLSGCRALSGTVRCLCQTSCQVLSVLSGAVGCVSDRRGDL